MKQEKKPTQLAIVAKDLELIGKFEQFNELLQHAPPSKWVKNHPFQRGVKYIPIGQVEKILRTLFPEFKIEIKNVQQMFNSVCVSVRVHYKHPVNDQWYFQDGVGAMGVQTDKGASASDLGAIKQDAIMKAAPAAESYAIKDACEKIGEIFGANMNRSDVVEMNSPYIDHSKAVEG